MRKIEKCPFCNGNKFLQHSSALYWQIVELNFVECKTCGLIFTNPMPEMDLVNEGNRALNILTKSRGTISQYRGGKEFTFSLMKKRENGILLDVGAAEGFFLKGVEDNSHWKAEGLEIIESAVKFANERLGVKVHQGTLESMKDCDDRYNYVRMNNIIEHVQDPIAFLQKANSIIKRGGYVYCSTPNGVQDGAILKVANKRGFKINLLENHFYYYPPKTLRQIFKSCGYKILHSYSEDISHTLKDFGFMRNGFHPDECDEHNLNYYRDKHNNNFDVTDTEIGSYKYDKSVKGWKLKINKYLKEAFRLRMPYFIPLGHQQHVYAQKL